VAERAYGEVPFENATSLQEALASVVDTARPEEQMALIKAHPDLGGKLGVKRELTDESTREQASLGLDQLNEPEYQEFTSLNASYTEKFGFPFIICVGLVKDRSEILASFRERIALDASAELAEALRQIHLIAGLRLAALMED